MKNKTIFNNYIIYENGKIINSKTNRVLKHTLGSHGYKTVSIRCENAKYKNLLLHRLLAFAFLGLDLNSKLVVDHINNDKLDNELTNLQIVTRRLNNTKEFDGKTVYPGVHMDKGRKMYRARIKKEGKYLHLGSYSTPIEAYRSYLTSLKRVDLQAYNYYINIFGE